MVSGETEIGPKLIKWTARVMSRPDHNGDYRQACTWIDIDETFHCYDFKTWEPYFERDELALAFFNNEIEKQLNERN
jgi:hypothetical protein